MKTITHAEAYAIDRVSKLCDFWGRGIINDAEFVTSMLHDLSHCHSRFAAEQCVARLPSQLHDELTHQIQHWLSSEHPGELFVFAPCNPTDHEMQELDCRVREFGNAMLNYLANPTGEQGYQTDPLESPPMQWLKSLHASTIDGQYCKRDNCNNCRVKFGVFCPEHHYEMLHGEPPPNAT